MEIEIKNRIVICDEEDSDTLLNYSWCFDSNSYLSNRGKINNRFHRYIMLKNIKDFSIENNIKESSVKIDHINRNVLDNRKCNLRCVSHSDNLMNRPKQKNNNSGYKGISIARPYNKNYYNVSLKYKGISHKKVFTKLEDAINWRINLIKELNIFEP